jgi:pterin-4a-carbinolamine dehydratase
MKQPLVFISYRRDDEGPASRFVKAELDDVFGSEHVFMDLDNIQSGDQWKDIIKTNLEACDCLIVIIGRNWLRVQDEFFVRRIDKKDDWVRIEIETALRRGIKIIPLFIGGALTQKEALPKSIQKLLDSQGMMISAITWQNDIAALVDRLVALGFKRTGTDIEFPNPKGIKDTFPLAMTESELKDALIDLPGWEITYAPIPGQAPKMMQEISKKYEFKTFEEAVEFMHNMVPFISKTDHHPRWENIWRAVIIHLSSWDIGHKVSKIDIEMAHQFDKEFSEL